MTISDVELSDETRETLDKCNLRPLWEIERDELSKIDELEADIWKWQEITSAIEHIANDIPAGLNRCVTVPVNTTYDSALSRTIFLGIRTISPGESPPAHRHGGDALRFMIDSNTEMKSTVAGEQFVMNDNDLITIPQWEWHGHENRSETEVICFDVHDTPLTIDALTVGNPFEQVDGDQEPTAKPNGYFQSRYGEVRPPHRTESIPGPFDGIRKPTPPHRFGWDEISDALDFAEGHDVGANDPYDGVVLEYTNPAKATAPLFTTYRVFAQRILDGTATDSHRHNSTEIYHVIEGSGVSVSNGEEIHWDKRDIFVIPPNKTHYHNPDNTATLLRITDQAFLEAFNFYHEVDEQ